MTVRQIAGPSSPTLRELLGVSYMSQSARPGVVKVATIAEIALTESLMEYYRVAELLPGCVEESLRSLSPDVVVLQAATLSRGVWAGSVESADVMSPDLVTLGCLASSGEVDFFVITDLPHSAPQSAALRSMGTEFFPNRHIFTRLASKAARSKLYTIVDDFARSRVA